MPKRNFEYLLRQFKTKYDTNKDGKISSEEWHTWVTGDLILLCYKQSWDSLKVSKFRKQIFQPKLLPKNEPTNLFFYPDYLSG